jgi:phosphoserine phosphatase RsbU/P
MQSVSPRRASTSPLRAPDIRTGRPSHPARWFRSGWQARAVSLPATEFSGDFYMTHEIGDEVWFALGDFSGHGLGAAIFAAMVQEELDRAIDHDRNSCLLEIIASLDSTMRDVFPSNRFASLVVGRAEPDGGVTLVNAGHPPPLVARATGEVDAIGATGPVVGIVPSPRWGSARSRLEPGDCLLLYTDGLLELHGGTGEEFGLQRIEAAARRSRPETAIASLVGDARRFAGGRRTDDLTIFVLSR